MADDPTLPSEHYPLFCIDSEGHRQPRYRGPFLHEFDATAIQAGDHHPSAVRRCRRVTLWEILPDHWWWDLVQLLKKFSHDPPNAELSRKAWTNHPKILHYGQMDHPGQLGQRIVSALGSLFGTFRLDMFVCEGDE